MPNDITNIMTLDGDRLEIRKLMERIKNDELGIGTIDFGKIIPMPENIYKGSIGPEERKLYGEKNWYDWCLVNWGTKWNAYDYDGFPHQSDYKEMRFHTANSAPHPIFEKLAEMFPDIKITHEWADEDIGMNCGRKTYENGERIEEYYPENKKDLIDFAARVMDVSAEDYGLYLNAAGTGYIDMPEEDYEIVEVLDRTALFTNSRMTDADVPEGLHCYHLRESDDGGRFATIEKNVTVNHGGTVIFKEPLDLGEHKYIAFDDESSPNFTGDQTNMESFINGMPEQTEEINMNPC